MQKLNVLILCEESQAVCKAFRNIGHRAFSCDLQKCAKNGVPGWHINADANYFLDGGTRFKTQDGRWHTVHRWDLIIAHPPCTYLCKVSSVHMMVKGHIQWPRLRSMILARRFFLKCLSAPANFVAVENPLPMARARLPRPTTYVEPYDFGHNYSKKTLLWLKNLPPLFPTSAEGRHKEFHKSSRGKYRSRTFPGIAEAMAKQWSQHIILAKRNLTNPPAPKAVSRHSAECLSPTGSRPR